MACRKDKAFSSTVVDGAKPAVAVSYSAADTNALAIQFKDQSQHAASYYWQFGDGTAPPMPVLLTYMRHPADIR
jgi:PKD repeat protein